METNPKNLAVILRTNIQKITQNSKYFLKKWHIFVSLKLYINIKVNQIENLLQQIGTPRDSSDLRSKM